MKLSFSSPYINILNDAGECVAFFAVAADGAVFVNIKGANGVVHFTAEQLVEIAAIVQSYS